jgi:adenosine deaminase/aminodeoxyfutalosine deaminase
VTTPITREPTIVDSLPKAELHLHLEGSIRPDTAVELAARHGVKIKREDVIARYNYSDFIGFLEAFKWVTSYLRDPEDYALVTRYLAEELLRQNVAYAEVTISAGVMLRRTQNVEANLTAIQETAQSVPFARLRLAWILDATRQFGPDAAVEVARSASQLQRLGVVAFGMGGDELAGPTVNFRPAFDLARSEGLHLVCHAGEVGGPELIRESIDLLNAERIGHGIAVMRDPALAEFLAARRVPLEICPTSNVCTGALAKQTGKADASMQDHPLAKFIKQGLTVTLSTDDPAMFHTDLLSEYSVAASLGLSSQQLVQLAQQSVSASFLPPDDKRRMLDEFRAAAKSLLL